jgi:tryptophan synthase alpha chain
MSNINQAFADGKAFGAYIPSGAPDLSTTAACARKVVFNGATFVVLSIPFSDPSGESPTIQQANYKALEAGTTTDKVFALVKELRTDLKTPLALMTYANVVFSYGAEKFISNCHEVGVDALIVPDIPYEEKGEFLDYCRRLEVDLISFIAPASPERIAKIAKDAKGFLYVMSGLDATSSCCKVMTDLPSILGVARQNTNIPCIVDLDGIPAKQAAAISNLFDGVILRNAIVQLLSQHGQNAPKYIGELVKTTKANLQE